MFAKKKREKHMIEKGRDRKRVWLPVISISAYTLAYLYVFLGSKIQISEDVVICGFFLLTFVGAACALIYGSLPEPELSPEGLEELEKMLEEMKKDIQVAGENQNAGIHVERIKKE